MLNSRYSTRSVGGDVKRDGPLKGHHPANSSLPDCILFLSLHVSFGWLGFIIEAFDFPFFAPRLILYSIACSVPTWLYTRQHGHCGALNRVWRISSTDAGHLRARHPEYYHLCANFTVHAGSGLSQFRKHWYRWYVMLHLGADRCHNCGLRYEIVEFLTSRKAILFIFDLLFYGACFVWGMRKYEIFWSRFFILLLSSAS